VVEECDVLRDVGLAAIAAGFLPNGEWSPVSSQHAPPGRRHSHLRRADWGEAAAVYTSGRITFHGLQGAVVLYLSLATIFAAAYGLIRELSPAAFANLLARAGVPEEVGTMLYFSLTTLQDRRR
jgi:hypothetical protein